jgi:hypothetical protein
VNADATDIRVAAFGAPKVPADSRFGEVALKQLSDALDQGV